MLLRSTALLFTLVMVSMVMSKNRPTKEEILKQGRLNVRMNVTKDRVFDPVEQGECMEGWVDGSSVGLGCVYADMKDQNVNETTAETICSEFGEGGRLVEILKYE